MPLPAVEPQWAIPVAEVPEGPGWVHEVELVGPRVLAMIAAEADGAALWTAHADSGQQRRGEAGETGEAGEMRAAHGEEGEAAGQDPRVRIVRVRRAPPAGPRGAGEPSRDRRDHEACSAPWLARELATPRFAGSILDGILCTVGADGEVRRSSADSGPDAGPDSDSGKPAEQVFFAFDLPVANGRDLRGASLIERKRALRELLAGAGPRIRLCEHVLGAGAKVFDRACELGVEGVISKRVDSIYEGGRSPAWLEVKCARRLGLVVGGFTAPHGSRRFFGALLLGSYDAVGRLVYRGKVGSGFGEDVLAQLRPRLERLRQEQPAFDDPPVGSQARGVSWVRPELEVDVEFGELTDRGKLRHARFKGLRAPASEAVQAPLGGPPGLIAGPAGSSAGSGSAPDSADPASRSMPLAEPITEVGPAAGVDPAAGLAGDLAGELVGDLVGALVGDVAGDLVGDVGSAGAGLARASASETGFALVQLSQPDRCVVPKLGLRKRDLADYVMQVAESMLAHVRGRALSVTRSGAGDGWAVPRMDPDPDSRAIDAGTAALPEGVQLETLLDRADRSPDGTSPRCLSVYDGLGLVGLIELDVVEIQTRGARLDKRDHPDRLVFELVGEGGPEFERVLEAAGEVRARLADFGLVSFVKTSGREHSLDVVVPVQRRRSYASVARFCRVFAEGMVAAAPRRYTLGTGRSAPEASVRGKVAIRHALNSRAATMIAPYSLCAATGGLVSTPLAWDELRTGLRPDSFDPASVATRLARLGEDPWTGYFTLRQWITKASFRRLDINPDLRELAARI